MLTPVKGWVLAVLAMLAASGCAWLRAAPVPARERAARDLRCARRPSGWVGTRVVPAAPQSAFQAPRVEQGSALAFVGAIFVAPT